MFNQLSNLTAGLCATGGLIEAVAPFDVSECLSSLSGFEDDVTLSLDELDTLAEHYDTPVMVNLDWSMRVVELSCLLMGVRELSRKVQADLVAQNAREEHRRGDLTTVTDCPLSSDSVVVINAVMANQGAHHA